MTKAPSERPETVLAAARTLLGVKEDGPVLTALMCLLNEYARANVKLERYEKGLAYYLKATRVQSHNGELEEYDNGQAARHALGLRNHHQSCSWPRAHYDPSSGYSHCQCGLHVTIEAIQVKHFMRAKTPNEEQG